MKGKLEGKVALITGGTAGIGRASAAAFAGEGARVVIAARGISGGDQTVERIQDIGGEAIFVRTDVSNASDVEALIRETVERFGRLDYAVNCAGVEDSLLRTHECTEENWDRVLGINLKGAFLCMKFEISQMLQQGGGSIVNVISGAGMRGFPGMPAYSASKGGLVQLTRTAALEYADDNIHINGICPGGVKTSMVLRVLGRAKEIGVTDFSALHPHPYQKADTPGNVAETILWLATQENPFMVGHVLVVDAGWSIQ